MKLMKSLILSSAAGLVVVSGAQAADLPLKAKAVEYVKVCSLYGAGFYYIPGTDTCIKLGGYIRADMGVNTNSVFGGNTAAQAGAQNRFTNGFTWRSRADLNIDTRTATEYGVVRTYMDTVFTWTSDSYGPGGGAGSTVYSPLTSSIVGGGTAIGSAPGNGSAGTVSGGQVGVYYAFIQFAGFTMGKAVSQFSAPWANYPGNITDALAGGGGATTGVNQFTYTAEFGNGVSASIGAQDPTQYYQAGINNVTSLATGGYGASDYAGTDVPDFVGQLRVDQAWGLFQASFAAHENNPAYYGATSNTGGPGNKWGWAGQLALSIKNIPTGPGDSINISGVYTDGATRYNIQDLAAAQLTSIAMYGGSNLPGALGSLGAGVAPDSIFGPNGSQQLVQTWGMRGAFNHNWNPYWSSSIFGAYAAIHYNSTARALICGGTFAAGFSTCNPNFNIGQLGANLRWTPVKNLTFTTEAIYTTLDQRYVGTYATANSNGRQGGTYEAKDQNTWSVSLRAQRTW